jgi:hypothetical protein
MRNCVVILIVFALLAQARGDEMEYIDNGVSSFFLIIIDFILLSGD